MDLTNLQIAGWVNPILLAVVGYFLLRFVNSIDEIRKELTRSDTQLQLFHKDLERIKEDHGVIRRDQASIWREIDRLKRDLGTLEEEYERNDD